MNTQLTNTRHSAVTALAFGAVLFSCATSAQAQVDELIVTVEKRQSVLSDVSIAATAYSGDTLQQLNVDNTLDLVRFVPNITIGQNSGEGDFPFISIRGVSQRDFADTNESPSAVYLDEFYKANIMGLDSQIFDVDRVEILRGPQGTLYGRNATGGLIKYVTKKPGEEFEGFGSVSYGQRSRLKLEGGVGGPIAGIVSGRVSFLHHEFDGYTENLFPGREDTNALDATAVRGQLLFEPTDALDISFLVQHYENDNDAGNSFAHKVVSVDPITGLAVDNPDPTATDAFGYRDPTPNDPRDTNADRDIFLNVRQFTAIGTIEWDLDVFNAAGLTLTSVTGYENTEKDATFDSDSGPTIRGTETHPDAWQFSQELRLAGETANFDWLAGFYYFEYQIDGNQRRLSAAGFRDPVFFDLETDSWALFANGEYRFNDQWRLNAGIRYTQEDKVYALNNTDFGLVFDETTVGDAAKQDDDNISFNVRVSWDVTEDHLLYAGVSRGFKAGTFNVGFTPINFDAIPVDPERLTSYEIGFKSAFAEDTLRVSGAGFYYDYKDSQAFQFDGATLSATTFNRDAEVWGGELEVNYSPIEGLDFLVIGSYLDATLKDVELPGPLFGGGLIVDTEMPLAPKWTWTGLARYQWDAPWGGSLAIQGDVTYKSSHFFDAFNSPSHFEDGYAFGNARLSWLSEDEQWEFSVWAENITDEEYRTYAFDLSFLGFATDVFAKPRWVGGTITYKFGG